MRTSKQIKDLGEAAGLEVTIINRGTSYRAGGDIIVSPKGWWENKTPVRVTLAPEGAFDGTGYDDRGRGFEIWNLIPDVSGMSPISKEDWEKLPESERALIGKCSEGRSGEQGHFFGRPAAVEAAKVADTTSLFGGLLAAVKPYMSV